VAWQLLRFDVNIFSFIGSARLLLAGASMIVPEWVSSEKLDWNGPVGLGRASCVASLGVREDFCDLRHKHHGAISHYIPGVLRENKRHDDLVS